MAAEMFGDLSTGPFPAAASSLATGWRPHGEKPWRPRRTGWGDTAVSGHFGAVLVWVTITRWGGFREVRRTPSCTQSLMGIMPKTSGIGAFGYVSDRHPGASLEVS